MSPCPIRPAVLRDAKAIALLHCTSTRQPPESLVQQQAFWRDAIEYGEPQVQVACDGEAIVGFVGYDRCRDKRTPPTMGEIWAIHVAESRLGQGVGLALWDSAREGLLEEGCTDVSVWIELACERALRFHELAGFKRDMPSLRTVPRGGMRVEEIRLKRKL